MDWYPIHIGFHSHFKSLKMIHLPSGPGYTFQDTASSNSPARRDPWKRPLLLHPLTTPTISRHLAAPIRTARRAIRATTRLTTILSPSISATLPAHTRIQVQLTQEQLPLAQQGGLLGEQLDSPQSQPNWRSTSRVRALRDW